jgi:hypothetical protein
MVPDLPEMKKPYKRKAALIDKCFNRFVKEQLKHPRSVDSAAMISTVH